MTEYKSSLAQRIVIAFTLMTTVLAGAFASGIVIAAHVIEERLISTELSNDLEVLLKARNADDLERLTRPNQSLYLSDGTGHLAMPKSFSQLPPGFHEVLHGEHSYHGIIRDAQGRRYVLLQDQSDFERREQVMYLIVAIGATLSVALAALLGWALGRKVLAPVRRLAQQVRHRDQLMAGAPPLAPDYACDEVGQLAAAFDETLSELRAALKREQLFTSDVSHELRTPLMVLVSSCELLQNNSALDARGHRQVERIARASNDMQKLVETFLQLARVENGQLTEKVAPQTSLLEIADELIQEHRQPIEAKGLRLEYVQQPPLLNARYSRPFLRSVMGNLLGNARHYCDSGYIQLTLTSTGFVVEDSGIGIPETLHETVFDPFVRGERERGDGLGLGLGLSLVQRICHHEGWTIHLMPAVPNGCRFEVKLTPP